MKFLSSYGWILGNVIAWIIREFEFTYLPITLKRQHVLFIDTCLDNWLLFDKHGDILSILRLIKGLLFSFCSKHSFRSKIGIVYISEKDVKLFHVGSCLGTKLALDLIFIQFLWRFFLLQFINLINWITSNAIASIHE